MWTPTIRREGKPLYLAIADALAADVAAGRLASGQRLPPQRELADRLGVTLTTVTRAYTEAARRGLIEGAVGRGTFVRAGLTDEGATDEEVIDLGLNTVPPHAHAVALANRLAVPGRLADRLLALEYPPPAGLPAHAEAGRRWFEQRGWDSAGHAVLVTAGAQHAITVALMALLPRGGDVLAEEVTYAGLKDLAGRLGVTVHPVAMDEGGMRADDLDAVCRRSGARVLYLMPALQNPTGLTMAADRQAEIASVAERRDLTVIEDDTYGFVAPAAPLLASRIAGRTLVITSLSKSVAGGLRVGFIAAPPPWRDALLSAIWNTVVTASPVTAAIAAALIADGTAATVAAWKREELAARQAIARRVLGRVPASTSPASPHVWLQLDRPWKGDVFAARARSRGVVVTPASAFSVREGASPRAVRAALGVPRTRERLTEALKRLADLQREGPEGTAAVL
ncbi:MAG TPA: PLP-dependent aminotransferase family protein [Vicinamibacterales bacterium]|nr:PLP-dependent aminotransferase family protein [Vicinamibacterales bacterium]